LSQYITAVYGAASGLSDAERRLLLGDAVDAVAHRDGLSHGAAAAQLDQAADRGAVSIEGDAERVAVTVHGQAVVAMTRAELRRLVGIAG
jgi:hypothetical protein